jgi:hypothetical protein
MFINNVKKLATISAAAGTYSRFSWFPILVLVLYINVVVISLLLKYEISGVASSSNSWMVMCLSSYTNVL